MTREKIKAIALLSGGLDSTLAIKIMREQEIEVVAVNFISPFCTCSPRSAGTCHLAAAVAGELGVKIRVLNKGLEYLKIVEKPRFGYGRGLNPCLDCRIFMLRKAAALMAAEDAQFIVTGEVLGQRPMSQHRAAMELIERESGLIGRILRPLSAQCLPPTLAEQNGWVDRARLKAIRGRSRAEQLALAKAKGVELFGCPSGGCLLTDPAVAQRLRDVFHYCGDYDLRDAKLSTFGRHFRLHAGLKAILGRNAAENQRLVAIAVDWPRLELAGIPGPLMLLRGEMRAEDRQPLGRLLKRYAQKSGADPLTVQCVAPEQSATWSVACPAADEEINRWRI